MLHLALVLLAAPLPDAMDFLKSADVVPNIGLLLDASCSMSHAPLINTQCTWFAANYNANDLNMTKNEVMRAALVGCQGTDDGILDRWYAQANFSIFDFGRSTTDATLRAPFGSTLAALEAAALAVPATGSTPISNAIRAHGRYISTYFTNANTTQCRPNFILLLTDGDPNGGPGTFDFNCIVPGDPRENLYVAAESPWLGADYMTRHKDLVCGLTGEQKILTSALGFGAPGSFNPTTLSRIATSGRGQSYVATNLTELDSALRQMISSMVARSAIFSAPPSIEVDRLFAGNYIYTASFRPNSRGPWAGTLKKHCVEPARQSNGRYSTTDKTCLFSSDDGQVLLTNPTVQDQWTLSATTAANIGGAGQLVLSRLGAAGTVPASSGQYPRTILSWRPDVAGYVAVRLATWLHEDTYSTGLEHARLVNNVHGYTYAASTSGAPMLVGDWPYGDAVHAPTTLLKYGTNCQSAGQCYVLSATNDGLLHAHDAATGFERSALVPAEIWKPTGIANDMLRNIQNQPEVDATHRYFVDGGMQLFHDDTNGDGIIQSTEKAYLIFGLGRGGSAYYQIPVSQFDGVFDTIKNPVRPITGMPGTATAELRDTWATPWLGATEINGVRRRLAVFPTGHVRRTDFAVEPMPAQAETRPRIGGSASTACATAMSTAGMPASACGNYSSTTNYPDTVASDTTIGPVSLTNVAAYRLIFSNTDIQSVDSLVIADSQGRVAATVTGSGGGAYTSPWIYDRAFLLRWITNGASSTNKGWKITSIETKAMIPAALVNAVPGVWVTDLDKWNGTTPRAFASTALAGANVVEIAKTCSTSPEICVDATANPDLAEMTCPISTEISVLTTADRITTLYWGDECGQLWRAWPTNTLRTTWKARRLLRLNNTRSLNGAATVALSKDMRKVFRRLDLVPSGCPGKKVTGVYFGTGNVQRPAGTDELADSAVTNGRDVVGVLWDTPELASGLVLGNLADATSVAQIDPRTTAYGWYFSLADDEKMLRDPVVFDGIAYFKTFRPTVQASECTRSTGLDTVYAVDNCSARAALEGAVAGYQIGDRVAWTGNTDVGGGLMLFTPKQGSPMVSAVNISRKEVAAITPIEGGRVPRIYQWREPRSRP